MKKDELLAMIREEIESALAERTIASRTPPRKMSAKQVSLRDKIGKKMLASPTAVARFKKNYGKDWDSYLWAQATNVAMNKEKE